MDLRDACGIAGLFLASAGAWLIYPPAALLGAGITLMAFAVASARR